ncbi:unnamed protein product [Vicia faba]|uniref:Reverse transcriptase domain-containing protein n=1 Tax=Vicia faba TaxID=3906 RepID=A0AAV1ARJ2_VICFA|nr:unnamed protein product [Vicia faba]
MAAIEVVHHIKTKTKGKIDNITLKLDVIKAYDMINWNYLRDVLITMVFNQKLNAPIISHLLFTDDCFLFFKVVPNEASEMKNILDTYEEASGQAINLQKSELFCSRNIVPGVKDMLADTLRFFSLRPFLS